VSVHYGDALQEKKRIDLGRQRQELPGCVNTRWNYDYLLGGKDNISQVVSRCPHSGRAAAIQARHANFSNK
jgi:hypothetical protein